MRIGDRLRNVALKSKKATDWAKIKKSAISVNNMKSKEFLPIYTIIQKHIYMTRVKTIESCIGKNDRYI